MGEDDSAYRFEAPEHEAETLDDLEDGELYANIYFDVDGFEEAGIGERGVPPVIILGRPGHAGGAFPGP